MKELGFIIGSEQKDCLPIHQKYLPIPTTHAHINVVCVNKIVVAVRRVDQFTEECGRGSGERTAGGKGIWGVIICSHKGWKTRTATKKGLIK